MTPKNPFLISGYYSPEYFCDREQETKKIMNALYNGRNITLIAPRRIGKTGLIHHTFYCLKDQSPEIITLYLDLFPTQTLGQFVSLFASKVLGKLDSAPKVSVDISPSEEVASLKEIFEYLASSDKRCYIAIDEFQQITEYPEKGVEALLRSYIQFLPNVNFIFAGSKQHVMQEMFTSAKKPFYQSTQLLTLDTINRETYADFAIRHFENQNLKLSRKVFNVVYDRFDGQTWYIQNILNRIYGNACFYNNDITADVVDIALNEILSEMNYFYATLINTYTIGQVSLLKAIAKEGCVSEIMSGDFINKYNLRASSSVQGALKKLLDHELVYRSANGYVVYDRFMCEWLRRQPF